MPSSSSIDTPFEGVSVVMPTYNAAATVDRAIDSVQGQSHADWRLIAVDDASRDDTLDRLARRAAQDPRITILRSGVNKGPAAARNLALSTCDGAWIAVLDADDAWQSDRLSTLLSLAEQQAADVICDNLLGFDDHLGRETSRLFTHLPTTLGINAVVSPYYAGTYNLGYLKPIVRRSFLQSRKIAYDESLRTGEDLLFLLELLVQGARAVTSNAATYIYTTPVGHESRRLSQSTSTQPRDHELAQALGRFARAFAAKLDAAERRAIGQRITFLEEIGPISEFRHARLQRQWIRVGQAMLESPAVRRHVWHVLTGQAPRHRRFDPFRQVDR